MLGRVIRDIQRKCPEPDPKLKEELKQAQRIYDQQRKDKGKVYSVHAPEVESISKGKAHKRYEFGVKVSVGTSSRGGAGASEADGGKKSETSVCGPGLQRARIRGGDGRARGQTAQRQDGQATVEVDEKTSRGGTRNQPPKTRASDESQSTERNPGRSTQRSAKCSGNELQEVAQASGEDLALHPMGVEPGRNPTSHAFQSEHCPLP